MYTSELSSGKSKLAVNIKLIGDFFEDKNATNVVIKIPMPPTAASAKCVVGKGRAKYEPGERALVWRISNFPGQTEATLDAVVDLITATRYDRFFSYPIFK